MQLLKCPSGIRKSKTLLPKMILSRFVTAGRSVGVASLESMKQLIPAERQAATPVRAAWGAPSRAGTDPSGARRMRPDFSHVHCKAGSRLFSRAKRDDRPPLPKEEEGEKYKHAWAERPARAVGVEAPCCCRCLRLGREVRGCQEVLAPSLHSSVPMAAALSHIPNAVLAASAAAETAELPARLSSPLAKEAAGRGLISSGS